MVEVTGASELLRRLLLFAVLTLPAFPSGVSAHQLDEYLQATLVAIDSESIRRQINLTPGVNVAEQVLAEMACDRNGVISANEGAAYAELTKRDLVVRLDERNVEVKLIASYFPEPAKIRTGFGII
jgi:hypothetical protein